MEPNMMLEAAAVLFATGALGGLVMAGIRLKGSPRPPSAFAMAHGILAAAGLTLLLYAAFTVGIPPLAQLAAAVLLVAALVGTWINLRYHAQMQALPIPTVVIHAAIAVAGFGLLLAALFQMRA
ncbi:MAG: hypothetical protein M3O62_06325 [Pseudomonadota bacterium]|nr:hypothetical protein [Pseudomonadota bacterium]